MSRGKPTTTRRFERSRVAASAPGPAASSAEGTGWDELPLDETDLSVDPAELRDFLAGDLLDVRADPIFKERLRQKLWRLVRVRYGGQSDDD